MLMLMLLLPRYHVVLFVFVTFSLVFFFVAVAAVVVVIVFIVFDCFSVFILGRFHMYKYLKIKMLNKKENSNSQRSEIDIAMKKSHLIRLKLYLILWGLK